jgi:cell wall-associated NlpC family hydrolase
MPDSRRTPRLAYLLAIPVIVLVYVGAFGSRVWAALRPAVATVLGVTVIGSVYADEALKRTPATPMRAAAALALAVALVGPGMAPTPAAAASDPLEAVMAAARGYLGHRYQLGAEGPKQFDCSGLIYRIFSDAGELPRIGGMRLRAVGYMRWFVSRGLFTRDESEARRGDLVVWAKGDHIGIYIGDGKAISALINPYGVSVHSLHGIHKSVDYFLHVNWSNGDGPGNGSGDPGNGGDDPGNGSGNGPGPGDNPGPGDGPGANPGDPGAGPGNGDSAGSSKGGNNPPDNNGGNNPPDNGGGNDPGNPPADNPGTDNPGVRPPNNQPNQPDTGNGKRGLSTGTMNMRVSADPSARIVGWVSRGSTFKIIATGKSPAGYLWYQVETVSGKQGWIYSFWVREL